MLIESGRRGSNPRPSAWKANALSTELLPRGQRWIRTTEGVRQQIYSLPHLATLVFAQTLMYNPYWVLRVQSYNYFFKLQAKLIIFIAVSAHSLPLLPSLPPALSSACSMLSVVSTPKITGILPSTLSCVMPWVTP